MIKQLLTTFLVLIFTFSLQSQIVSGIIRDAADNKALAYVNISIQSSKIGTVSKYDGRFSIDVSGRPKGSDSLKFSIIGYETATIPIATKTDSIVVTMKPESFMLESVIVSPKTPEEYIKLAIDKIPDNYIAQPFNGIIYFRTMIRLNGKFIESSESLIKGYIMPVMGEFNDETRLKLLAFKYFDEEEEAISTIVKKRSKKKGEKMALDGLDSIMINMSSQLSENFGIHTQIDSNLIKQMHMKGYPEYKAKYFFEHMVRNEERNLMKIGFKGNIKGYAKQRGNILLEENSLAFEGFNAQISSSSLRIKALAMLVGIGFNSFDAVMRFKSIPSDNGWIPDLMNVDVFVDFEKNRWFAKDIPIVIEATSYMRFLEIEVPATDMCDEGRIIQRKIPIKDQFKSDNNTEIWKKYEQQISRSEENK